MRNKQIIQLRFKKKPHFGSINKKKRTCHLLDFAVSADHKIKVKEGRKLDKFLDLAQKADKAVEYRGKYDTNHS